MRRRLFLIAAIASVQTIALSAAQTSPGQAAERTGEQLYRSACVSCHGPDGRGQPKSIVGFETPLPDFTDCSFATPEPDPDWAATILLGGAARAFDRHMPAFGDALTEEEVARIVGHLRTLCTEPRWPRGDLNLPRALVTEKAFPENEALVTTTVTPGRIGGLASEFLYEHRLGARGQYEVNVPFELQRPDGNAWTRGLGDIAIAYKHVLFASRPRGSIVSAGAEMTFPTGKEDAGVGLGRTIAEPFATMSQMLPRDGFFHLHAGAEFPFQKDAAREAFFRTAIGKTFAQNRWGRTWSPIVELLGAREFEDGATAEWDLLPEMQVSLSTRQHILINAGIRIPLTDRDARRKSFVMYFLWDWFDGGLFDGWR
jgi:mono/diheme cytochrome c family protein